MGRLVRRLFLIATLAAVGALWLNAPARAAEGAPPDGPVFVKIPSISFSVVGVANKNKKEVQILVSLELEKGQIEAVIDPYRRRLQDAFLISMAETWDSRAPDAPPVQGEEIKAKLLKAATDITGPGIVKSVLLLGIGERSHVR